MNITLPSSYLLPLLPALLVPGPTLPCPDGFAVVLLSMPPALLFMPEPVVMPFFPDLVMPFFISEPGPTLPWPDAPLDV